MDIKQLNYFIALVEEKNISRAAKRLNMAQPPLSTSLKQMEGELNTRLFVRGSRSIYLTEAGKTLYERAKLIVSLYNETVEAVADESTGIKGILKIGVMTSASSFFLNEYVLDFYRLHPEIRFEITEGSTYELLERLNKKEIEAAFLRTPFSPNGLEYFTLASERLVACGKDEFFGDSFSVESLRAKPLITYRRWLDTVRAELEKRKISPCFVCINEDARTTLAWAKKGMGIAVVPKSACDGEENICIYPLEDIALSSDIVCMFVDKIYRSRATEALYEFMESRAK